MGIGVVVGFLFLFRWFRHAFKDPEVQALGLAVSVALVIGTVFYWTVEDWSIVDSAYFCVITLATVGYGDFVPTTDLAKIFTMGYALVGLGLFAAFASVLVRKSRVFQLAQEKEAARRASSGGAAPATEPGEDEVIVP